jgi:hypothetical protein
MLRCYCSIVSGVDALYTGVKKEPIWNDFGGIIKVLDWQPMIEHNAIVKLKNSVAVEVTVACSVLCALCRRCQIACSLLCSL